MKGATGVVAMLVLLALGFLTACGSTHESGQPKIVMGRYVLTTIDLSASPSTVTTVIKHAGKIYSMTCATGSVTNVSVSAKCVGASRPTKAH